MRILLLASCLGLLACGSSVSIQGAGGTGGQGASTSTTTGTATTTSTTSVTTSTSSGPIACGQTHEGFYLEAWLFNEEYWGCGVHKPLDIVGSVVKAFAEGIVIDSCPPNADCSPMQSTIIFQALNLYNTVPEGAFVRVEAYSADALSGCSLSMAITNVPVWSGEKNPWAPTDVLFIAATERALQLPPSAKVAVSPAPLGCYPGEGDCGPKDDYILNFSSSEASGVASVPMGATVEWDLGEGVTVRNLRSYESGYCYDNMNWSFWISRGAELD